MLCDSKPSIFQTSGQGKNKEAVIRTAKLLAGVTFRRQIEHTETLAQAKSGTAG